MRDDSWLKNRLEQIWELLFPDVPKKNFITVKFKGKWKNKFGHIKLLKDGTTEIAINSLFKDDRVPEYIIDVTLAHELVHYLHGFCSPLKRKYKYPHAGGIVEKELKKRGFEHLLRKEKIFEKRWIKLYKLLTRKF